MARAELLGWGVQVTYPNLTESSLSWAINEVLTNPKYEENVLKVRDRLQDQPQTPMDKAIFYIEYVLRHDGADFMKTSAQYLNVFQYNNLDVYGFFAIIIFVFLAVIRKICKFLFCKKKKLKTM